MSTPIPSSWLKEVEEYELRMHEYFTQCSITLREWHNKGFDDTEAYRLEYTRLSEEYQQYLTHMSELRGYVAKSSVSSKVKDVSESDVASVHDSPDIAAQTPVQQSVPSSGTAAVSYTKYYREMISYFNELLTSLDTNDDDLNPPDPEVDFGILDQEDEQIEDDADVDPTGENSGDMCCNPQAVMDQYFDRFGDTGKWDWASWNNYLSWIARTNPQWYGIFLEYSQSLGIDWDQMYSQWKLSDPITRQSFADEFVVQASSIQIPSSKQTVYHGLLFNESSHWELPGAEDTDELFCSTCQRRFETQRAFNLHLRGVTHIQRALEGLQKRNPECLDRNPASHYVDNSVNHYAWFQSQYTQQLQSEYVLPGSLYCELCRVHSGSYASLQSHLRGQRHCENVTIFQTTGDTSQLKDKRQVPQKAIARLQILLDVCTQPLIGLHYVCERQFPDDDDCVYFCELCNERFMRPEAIAHVCGVTHRTSYMFDDATNGPIQQAKAVMNKVRPTSKTTKKPKKKKTIKPPTSDDLEEGEITEESSDEESSFVNDAVDIPDQSDVTETEELITQESLALDKEKCAIPEDIILPRSVQAFRPDSESAAYIKTLEEQGHLVLGRTIIENGETPNHDCTNAEEQIATEAEWVLSRVRARQKEEEDCRREMATTAANMNKLKQQQQEQLEQEQKEQLEQQKSNEANRPVHSYALERRMRIQRGLSVMGPPQRQLHVNEFVYNNPSQCPESPIVTNESAPEKPQILPTNIAPTTAMTKMPNSFDSMDVNRQRLAVSSGAVEIILSALGALRDAGQLPETFEFGPETTTSVTLKADGEDDDDENEKEDEEKDSTIVTLNAVAPVPLTTPNTAGNIGTSIPQTPPFLNKPTNSPNIPPVQVNTNPSVGHLSRPRVIVTVPPKIQPLMSINMAAAVPAPPSRPMEHTDLQTQNLGVGLLGDPFPPVFVPSAPRPTVMVEPSVRPVPPTILAKRDHASISPQAITNNNPAKLPRLVPDEIEEEEEEDDVDGEPIDTVEQSTPSSRVASYMRADTNKPTEAMFDGYALYSRRSNERSQAQRVIPSRPEPPTTSFRSRQPVGPGRRKLSAIADMLGVNEPPAPPHVSNASQMPTPPVTMVQQHPTNTTMGTNITAGMEPSYLIPVSSFIMDSSISKLPHISYYIPKNTSFPELPQPPRPPPPPPPPMHPFPTHLPRPPMLIPPHPIRFGPIRAPQRGPMPFGLHPIRLGPIRAPQRGPMRRPPVPMNLDDIVRRMQHI